MNALKLPITLVAFAAAVVSLGIINPVARAADGSWNTGVSGAWTTAGSWLGGTIPGATSGTTNTDIATFGFSLTTSGTVTVDANRNIGGINFSNTSAFGYKLNAANLLLSSGGVIQT